MDFLIDYAFLAPINSENDRSHYRFIIEQMLNKTLMGKTKQKNTNNTLAGSPNSSTDSGNLETEEKFNITKKSGVKKPNKKKLSSPTKGKQPPIPPPIDYFTNDGFDDSTTNDEFEDQSDFDEPKNDAEIGKSDRIYDRLDSPRK